MKKIKILAGLFMIMLVLAGRQYWQVKKEVEVLGTDFNWNKEGGEAKIRGTQMYVSKMVDGEMKVRTVNIRGSKLYEEAVEAGGKVDLNLNPNSKDYVGDYNNMPDGFKKLVPYHYNTANISSSSYEYQPDSGALVDVWIGPDIDNNNVIDAADGAWHGYMTYAEALAMTAQYGGCGQIDGAGGYVVYEKNGCTKPQDESRGGPEPTPTPTSTPTPVPTPTPTPTPTPMPTPTPTPTPTPMPTPTPTPTPTPSPGTASLVIRKFKDDDKDGVWDDNEGSTGESFRFQYRFNDGDWHDYWTNASSGWGNWMTVNDGTKVEVKEIEKSGWVNTTGLIKIDVLNEGKSYYFDFGNYPKPGTVVVSPPPQAPETGGGMSLWPVVVGVMGIGLQILTVLF